MIVDKLGNVQYRHKKDSAGNEIATNSDGSVAYETIEPSKVATSVMYQTSTEPIIYKTTDDDGNEVESTIGHERYATGTSGEEKILYKTTIVKETVQETDEETGETITKEVLKEYITQLANSDGSLTTLSGDDRILLKTMDSDGNVIFERDDSAIVYGQAAVAGFDPSLRLYEGQDADNKYPFLEDVSQNFFDKSQFNLRTSVFDSFQLVKMTKFNYLNRQYSQRSIDNFFTSERSLQVD